MEMRDFYILSQVSLAGHGFEGGGAHARLINQLTHTWFDGKIVDRRVRGQP